jgi:hypothetical protein
MTSCLNTGAATAVEGDGMREAGRAAPLDSQLAERGYAVLREVVPPEAVEAALRHVHLDLVRHGVRAETLGSWLWSAHWFPHLKWDQPIVGLVEHLPDDLRDGDLCDPQIVLQPPDTCAQEPLVSHIDQKPEWAEGRCYRRIVGVSLSRAHAENGGLVVWPFDAAKEPLEPLEPGDVVVMHPDLPHASGYNREGAIRYAVYFRFLEPHADSM